MSDPSEHDYPYIHGRTPRQLIEAEYYPYQKLGDTEARERHMRHLAQLVGAESGRNLLVLHRAKTVKIRKTGWHVRAWKAYHEGMGATFRQAFSYPECRYERATGAHYIDESVFTISATLRLSAAYFTHVLYFDERKQRCQTYVLKSHIQQRRQRHPTEGEMGALDGVPDYPDDDEEADSLDRRDEFGVTNQPR